MDLIGKVRVRGGEGQGSGPVKAATGAWLPPRLPPVIASGAGQSARWSALCWA